MEDTPNSRHEGRVPVLSRWTFLRLARMAATGTASSACTSLKPKSTPRSGDEVQLVYEDWRTDWFLSMAQKMLEEFRAAHPHIRVFYTPDLESVEHKLLADMQHGTAPDVFQGCYTHSPGGPRWGHTLDLHPYVEADPDAATIDGWDPAQYRLRFTTDGHQFGFPKYHGALALRCSKDLLGEAGVNYPHEGGTTTTIWLLCSASPMTATATVRPICAAPCLPCPRIAFRRMPMAGAATHWTPMIRRIAPWPSLRQ